MGLLLTGFSRGDRYLQVDESTRARTTPSFGSRERNVRATLPPGTQARILGVGTLRSGNLALRVRVLNGNHKNKEMWVHYDKKDPAVTTFRSEPSEAEAKRAMALLGKADRAVRATTGPETKTRCEGCLADSDDIVEFTEKVAEKPAKAGPSPARIDSKNSRNMAEACYRFIDRKGHYGSWGFQLASILNERKYQSEYTRPGALGAFCPKFDKLSKEKRIQAWVWFWQSLGDEESACNLNVRHPTKVKRNGRWVVINPRPGHGLWALEKDPGVRRGRGPACRNISTLAGQARCAVDIMYQTQLARGATASNSRLRYWGPTYPDRAGKQIMPHMRRFKECF